MSKLRDSSAALSAVMVAAVMLRGGRLVEVEEVVDVESTLRAVLMVGSRASRRRWRSVQWRSSPFIPGVEVGSPRSFSAERTATAEFMSGRSIQKQGIIGNGATFKETNNLVTVNPHINIHFELKNSENENQATWYVDYQTW